MKGDKFNEGDPYKDLFKGKDYDKSLVEFEVKESSLDDEEVYDNNIDEMNDQ